MTDAEARAAGAALLAQLDALAAFTDEPGRLTRYYLTPAHRAAAEAVAGWMAEAGLLVEVDALGTVVGRTAPPSARPVLLIGSHIDTVRDAGRYDGALGVLAGIAVVAGLLRDGAALPFDIEVLAFGDEEGARFPATLAGSRAVAGVFDPGTLDLSDADGVTLRQALRDFGCDPAAIPAISRAGRRVIGYLELHIEQGPVLEAEGLALGVVTAIAGAKRLTATVQGEAGHAGTVPMALRHDALLAAAEIALAAEAAALETGGGCVATVGRLAAHPGVPNSVPGEVVFTLDIRAPENALRDAALQRILTAGAGIAARRGVAVEWQETYAAPAAACDPGLQAVLAAAMAACGEPPRALPSGAGHDAMVMGALGPMAMLFLRCRGGISHRPEESITAEDAGRALRVLRCAVGLMSEWQRN